MIPTTIPHGRTARRVEWAFLPPPLRELVEERCGSPVVEAASQTSGFTPGMASVLICADGTRHFVKAAADKAQRTFAEAYREEARKHVLLPAGTPAPALRWSCDAHSWIVLGFEYVEARAPVRPWTQADLAATLEALERAADVLTPTPSIPRVATFAEEFLDFPGHWDHVRAINQDLPHLEEAAALAARFADVTTGDTLVHTDVRDDNILIRPDGVALFCDWNWPVVGAAWLDTVFTLVGPRGDGIDVEPLLAVSPLTREVPDEHIDIVIALLTGFFLRSAGLPVPPTSPYLREHQAWQGQVCWEWLWERRGWE